MSRILAIGLCVLQIAILVQCNGLYTIVAPGTLRSKSDYHVIVSISDARSLCKLKVGLDGPEFNKHKTVEVLPNSSQMVLFKVPKLKNGDYNLTAEGLSGIEFKNTTKLNFAAEQLSIYIQTDKATYKPSDKVQFRVIIVDKNTRPLKTDGPVQITIIDSAQNIIQQIDDVKDQMGVYSGELQLSEFPGLGIWTIQVTAEVTTETKTFEVAMYVLPKFEVEVEVPKDVAIADGKITVTVIAKYTYGMPVKGTAVVSATTANYYYGDAPQQPAVEKTVKIDGKGFVVFDFVNDLKLSKNSYPPPIKMLAIIQEELTGFKQNSTATVNLHPETYQIQGVDTPSTYNPGKPVVITLVVKNLDGSPVQDKKNPVTLTVSPPAPWIRPPIIFNPLTAATRYPNMTTVRPTTTTTPAPSKSRNYTSTLNKDGMAKFEVVINDNSSAYYSANARYLDSTAYITSLSKFVKTETPVDNSLKVTVETKKPTLGKDVFIKVQNGNSIPYFVYNIIGRGNIVKSGHIKLPKNCNCFIFKITPTFDMVPQAKIYIYYTVNKDFLSAETTIDFEKDFLNYISIEAPTETKPGANVDIKVKSEPGSFVGLLAVDKSVLLLKSGNDLSKDKIFQDLSNYDSSTPYSFGYGRIPGSQSGAVTMTNANYPVQSYPIFYTGTFTTLAQTPMMTSTTSDIPRSTTLGPSNGGTDGFPKLRRPIFYIRPFMARGPMMMNARSFVSQSAKLGPSDGGTDGVPKLRQNFEQTWMFNNIKDIRGNEYTLHKKMPDTITTWVITGFSLNYKTGLALTKVPTNTTTFLPFFISTNLPYSVKRDEVIAISMIVFNYMDKTLVVKVTLDNSNREFDFAEATNDVTVSASEDITRTKTLSVSSNNGQSVSFLIRTKTVGPTSLKIIATSPGIAGDAVQQSLNVEPEGVTTYVNKAFFLNLVDVQEKQLKVPIDIPKNVVNGSQYIQIEAMGDLLGPTIINLDKLIRMPYGCGEQNMVNFVPNILVLIYLTATKKLTPALREKATNFLNIGYARELQYKHDDGSYSAFGKSDASGSTWLTAYVVKSFHQALPFTYIDPKMLEAGLKFLAGTQQPNGEFKEEGKVIDSSHSGGAAGLTAYVLLAFFENVESADKYKDVIEKGLSFLEKEVASTNDQYSMAISVSALISGKREESAQKILAKLNSLAKTDGERKWWSQTTVPDKSWYGPVSTDVEMTSYMCLALLKNGSAESVLSIIKWLLSQRNNNGGFPSTQDTVMGLQCLTVFAQKSGSGSGQMTINYVADKKIFGNITITPENSLVLQSHELPKTTKDVQIIARGKGSSLLQISYQYNIAEKDSKPSFNVTPVVKTLKNSQLTLVVCVNLVPLDGKKESNMAVMEVSFPSGYTADTDSFDQIKAVASVKRVDTKNSDSVLVIYFDSITTKRICVTINAIKSHAVAKQKPSPVMVYDYYDNNKRSTVFYTIKSSLCDICQGDDCGPGCGK